MLKFLKALIKPLVGIGILVFLFKKGLVDIHVIGKAFSDYPEYILGGMFTLLTLTTIAGWRWYLLLRAGGIVLSFRRVFSLHMIGIFFVTLIPGGTGGDLVKGYYVYKGVEEKKSIAISSIVVDRIIGLYGLLLWGCIGGVLNFSLVANHAELQAYFYFYLALATGVTLVLGLCFLPQAENLFHHRFFLKLPGQRLIQGWNDAFKVYRTRRKILLFSLLLTLGVHGSMIIVYSLCSWGLELPISLLEQSLVVPLMTLINGLPLSPGGIGVGEASGVYLYKFLQVSKGGEILMLFHILFFLNAFFGAPFYFFYRSK